MGWEGYGEEQDGGGVRDGMEGVGSERGRC